MRSNESRIPEPASGDTRPAPTASQADDQAARRASIDHLAPVLAEFKARQSDDRVKRDLELIHAPCGTHICDVEPDHDLEVLVRTAGDHFGSCPDTRAPHGRGWQPPSLQEDRHLTRDY
jgi:hypothetical protein